MKYLYCPFCECESRCQQLPILVRLIKNLFLDRGLVVKIPSSSTLIGIYRFKFAASDIPILKAAEEIMHPASFCAVRFVMSAIPFLPFVFWARDDVKTRNAGIELGLWVSLGYFVEALGLLTSDAGRASFISLFTVSSQYVFCWSKLH